MGETTISIPVDDDIARMYNSVPDQEKKKLRFLLGLVVRDYALPRVPLTKLIAEMGNKAAERGLSPEILESLLNET